MFPVNFVTYVPGCTKSLKKHTSDRIKTRSVGGGNAWGWGRRPNRQLKIKQTSDRLTIRSVSDGNAWGWGPTQTRDGFKTS